MTALDWIVLAVFALSMLVGAWRGLVYEVLSLLGWIGFMIMWVAQAVVFWRGMEAIRKFIDFCGPAVYVVMFALAIYLVAAAGWENIDFNLAEGGLTLTGRSTSWSSRCWSW